MNPSETWLPGHLPICAGTSVTLEPRLCGELKVGAGRVVVGDKLIAPGQSVRLWPGDRVEVANVAHASTALYSWGLCERQPSRRARMARNLSRLAQAIGLTVKPRMQGCAATTWCLQP
jgi:hypothetical protein